MFFAADLPVVLVCTMLLATVFGGALCARRAFRADKKIVLKCLVPQDQYFTLADLHRFEMHPQLLCILLRELCLDGVLVWKPQFETPRSQPRSPLTSVPTVVPTSDDFSGVRRVSLGDEPPALYDLHRYKFRVALSNALAY